MIIDGENLKKILDTHSTWILTMGRSGQLAELKGCNLDGANLEMANLPFANLQSASLKGAYLQAANFRKANLKRINLCGARLDGADFEGANLAGADLSFTVCSGTNFVNTNLAGSNFIRADLSDANFKGSNLHGANFKNANISFADMKKANLQNVNFEGTYLNESNFDGPYLKGINFKKNKSQKTNSYRAFSSEPKENEQELSDTDFTYQDLNHLISDSAINMSTKKEDLILDSIAIDQAMLEEALRGLIDKIKSNISNDHVKEIFKERYGIEEIDKIDFERGDIVSQNEQVSFKLDFLISCTLSLIIDRSGKCTVASSSNKLMTSNAGEATDGSTNQNY
jgi:uncharacterized protein YjbI with pentapeptide repeats